METWQTKFIKREQDKLSSNVTVHRKVLSGLHANDLISDEEKMILNELPNSFRPDELFSIMEKKRNAYWELINIFDKQRQSGAVDILVKGLVENGLQTTCLIISNVTATLSDLLPGTSLKNLHLRECLSKPKPNLSLVAQCLAAQQDNQAIQLVDPPPKAMSSNVKTILTRKRKFNLGIFKVDCGDKFVFEHLFPKEVIKAVIDDDKHIVPIINLPKDSERAARFFHVESKSFNARLLSDFTEYDDQPVHFVCYNSSAIPEEQFLFGGTTAVSETLRRHLLSDLKLSETVLEDDFLKFRFPENDEKHTLISQKDAFLCESNEDGDRMFKNFTNRIAEKCSNHIVIHAKLRDFFKTCSRDSASDNNTTILDEFVKFLCCSEKEKEVFEDILIKFLNNKNHQFKIILCFDFCYNFKQDEKLIKRLFEQLDKNHSMNFFILTLKEFGDELENLLNVVAYELKEQVEREKMPSSTLLCSVDSTRVLKCPKNSNFDEQHDKVDQIFKMLDKLGNEFQSMQSYNQTQFEEIKSEIIKQGNRLV